MLSERCQILPGIKRRSDDVTPESERSQFTSRRLSSALAGLSESQQLNPLLQSWGDAAGSQGRCDWTQDCTCEREHSNTKSMRSAHSSYTQAERNDTGLTSHTGTATGVSAAVCLVSLLSEPLSSSSSSQGPDMPTQHRKQVAQTGGMIHRLSAIYVRWGHLA